MSVVNADDAPSVTQRIHSVTGDRDAEAKALAEHSDDRVDEEDAELAVARAHGDVTGGPTPHRDPEDLADPADARAAHEDRASPST